MRVTRVMYAVIGAALAATLVSPPSADAQGWLKRIKDEAKAKVQQRTDAATDSVTNAAVDKAEHVVKCVASNLACIKKAAAAGEGVQVVNAQGQTVSSADSAQAMATAGVAATQSAATAAPGGAQGGSPAGVASQPPGTGAWLNYDFVPGDKVLFYDDFANDHVGDLPTHEDVVNGNGTVVDINGKKYFRTVTGAQMWITLPEVLPERFTIEATYFSASNVHPLDFDIGKDGAKDMEAWCFHNGAGVDGSGANGSKNSRENAVGISDNDFVHCRIMVDSGYVKAYLNEQRLAQLNGLDFTRTRKISITVPSSFDPNNPTLVTDIRVAEGGKPLYDALAANGRVSTHGILFATGSATIEGESTPTLAEIGDMLKAHPELKLTIEGHTDNVGDAAANQTLSDRRAAAVAQYLEATYQIDPSRLATKGFGDTKPVAPNTTPEGRQQNRRVELVKM